MTYTEIVTTTDTAHGAYRVRLEYDPCTGDPRTDYAHAATLVLSVRGYDLPREGALTARIEEAFDRGGFRLVERYLRAVHRVPVVLPVWGYDHGGLSVQAGDRTGQYADRWDSGLAGLAYILPAQVQAGWADHGVDVTVDALATVLRSEVEEYDAWAQGEVYGYIVERASDDTPDDWQHLESCWGHIGHGWAVQAASEAFADVVAGCALEHAKLQAAAAADNFEIDSMRLAEIGA